MIINCNFVLRIVALNLWWSLAYICFYIVTRIPIARQRVGKHIPANQAHATIGHRLLRSGPVNMHSWQQKTVFSVGSLPISYKRAESEDGTEYRTIFFLLFLVGWDWVHLVLRPLLAYCTSPRW
jgi:hypothetical protein